MNRLNLVDLAAHYGHLCWVESKAFETLGAWSAAESDPEVRVLLAVTSRHHGWHAQLWRSLLPDSPAHGADGLVLAPNPGWAEAFDRLAEVDGADETTARLLSISRFLDPWIRDAEETLLAGSDPVADAAALRWQRFIGLDHRSDNQVVEACLRARTGTISRASDHALVASLVACVSQTQDAP